MLSLFVLISLALIFVARCDLEDSLSETPAAKLVVYKYSETNPVVEGLDFVITYQLVNLGNAPANSIEVVDRYDPNSFESLSNLDEEGMLSYSYEELAPGAQTTFNVTIRPKLYGVYESTRARLRYSATIALDGVDPELKQGLSTSLGRVRIISKEEHKRNWQFFATHWSIFAAAVVLPVFVPLLTWSASVNSAYAIVNKQI